MMKNQHCQYKKKSMACVLLPNDSLSLIHVLEFGKQTRSGFTSQHRNGTFCITLLTYHFSKLTLSVINIDMDFILTSYG